MNCSEFRDAAGLPSDEIYFGNTGDIVRRIKPITRSSALGSMSEIDVALFGHDLEGGDVDGDTIEKEQAFLGAAGASTKEMNKYRTGGCPRDVPQPRDSVDNVVFNHEMQTSSKEIRSEILFHEMYDDAAGASSAEIDHSRLPNRLERFAQDGAEPWHDKMYEPQGDLHGTHVQANNPIVPDQFDGAAGVGRAVQNKINARAVMVKGAQGGPTLEARNRCGTDSSEVAAILKVGLGKDNPRFKLDDTGARFSDGAAGKWSRAANDADVPLLLDDADTIKEREAATRMNAGVKMQAVLNGNGYVERTDKVEDPYVKGHGVLPESFKDTIREHHLLQPDVNASNPGIQSIEWSDYKTDFELYMAAKNFGQGEPYGKDPLDTWYGKPSYLTEKEQTELRTELALENAYRLEIERKLPEETEYGFRRANFTEAKAKAEAEAEKRAKQIRSYHPGQGVWPYGVDPTAPSPIMYSTSNGDRGAGSGLAEKEHYSKGVDLSMAGRLAKQRLERSGQRSPERKHSPGCENRLAVRGSSSS